jgi:hypothetical protein
MAVLPFTARSSSHMALRLEATVVEVATSTYSPTNILPPSRPSHREYGPTLADKERERGNMDAQVRHSQYGFP